VNDENIIDASSRTVGVDKGWLSSSGVALELRISHRKNWHVTKYKKSRTSAGPLTQTKQDF
jgi:hypothetical protein